MMLSRIKQSLLEARLNQFPVVALIGPRQVGKTTLARMIADEYASVYLDLEFDPDRSQISDPIDFFDGHREQLIILDEIQYMPELFRILRGLIDQERYKTQVARRFLVLGSASGELLRQTSESLAGRIATIDLDPLNLLETPADAQDKLWLRGGMPDSFLSNREEDSLILRESFLRTVIQGDLQQHINPSSVTTIRRLLTMLAHSQGSVLNVANLARNLAIDAKTVSRYIDMFVDLMLVRRLESCHTNTKKRLVKSPKIYLRDSGLTHMLLGIRDRDALLAHPAVGGSWEGFVIENLISVAPQGASFNFYRTVVGAEIDLLLTMPEVGTWAIEIKRSTSPNPDRGFYHARQDLEPDEAFIVYPGTNEYSIGDGVKAIGVRDLMFRINIGRSPNS